MKKLALINSLLFLSLATGLAAQKKNALSISFHQLIVIISIPPSVQPLYLRFTPGNHEADTSLIFQRTGRFFSAALPKFYRGGGSGHLGGIIIYHISSGVIGGNLNWPLVITVQVPNGKILVWGGKVWRPGTAQLKFASYFVAREFPLILIPAGQFQIKTARFNSLDSLQAVYAWTDSLSRTQLPAAAQALDTAAALVGSLAPSYWHKFIVNYGRYPYTLVYIINNQGVVTGLEHYNSPYAITVLSFISVEGLLHTFLHSLIGKATIPEEYVQADGHYHAADALGFYEGLTTFLSTRYAADFPASLSALIYRAKLRAACQDLTELGGCGADIEKWYSAGYLFWVYLQSQGLDVELFSRWLYTVELINQPFPVRIRWTDVITWIRDYDQNLGKIAAASYQGKYLSAAFTSLQAHGWSPRPVWQVSRWYDFYIGPYALTPGGVQLPTDNYPVTKAYPHFLVNSDGSKLLLAPQIDNPALVLIKTHPDSLFVIEFSDGVRRRVANYLFFADGTPYFMHGTIQLNDQNRRFWSALSVYLK